MLADLARNQLNDRDDSSSLPGLLAEVRVLGVDAVSKLPRSLPLGCVLHDFGPERLTAVNNVGMLAEVVVPGWVSRPAPQRRDDGHAIAIMEVQGGIPTRPGLSALRVSRAAPRRRTTRC
jgi:hypothetical protein